MNRTQAKKLARNPPLCLPLHKVLVLVPFYPASQILNLHLHLFCDLGCNTVADGAHCRAATDYANSSLIRSDVRRWLLRSTNGCEGYL
jgi:hypothetical protein